MGEGGTVSALTSDTLQKLSGAPLAIVDFWAPWCGPCKRFAPIYEEVAVEMASRYQSRVQFYKVNVDEEPAFAQRNSVMTIPTVIGFSKGKSLDRFSGRSKEDFARWIDEMASSLGLEAATH